jgi:hypothetical protein
MSGNANHLYHAVFVFLVLTAAVRADSNRHIRFPLSARFSETMITLKWDEQPEAKAYNVYAGYDTIGFTKVNPVPIATRPQYSFLWITENGEKQKVVKGNSVRLFATALVGDSCIYRGGRCIESDTSVVVTTEYLRGFSGVRTAGQCGAILRPVQKTEHLNTVTESCAKSHFVKLYPRLARRIDSLYRRTVNPRDEGACVPMSTLAAKYFTAQGIPCYRGQGTFITQFHSFNVVVVDSVEYILDFTADQFLPASSPVFMPRDFCSIDSTGRPTDTPQGTFTPMYRIEKLFHPDNVAFSETDEAAEYRNMLDALLQK